MESPPSETACSSALERDSRQGTVGNGVALRSSNDGTSACIRSVGLRGHADFP